MNKTEELKNKRHSIEISIHKVQGDIEHNTTQLSFEPNDIVEQDIYHNNLNKLRDLKNELEIINKKLYKVLDTNTDIEIDEIINNKYEGFVTTYEYNEKASIELDKWLNKILITEDRNYMHINSRQSSTLEKHIQDIISKYNLKELNPILKLDTEHLDDDFIEM